MEAKQKVSGRIFGLDLIKAVAIAVVILVHLKYYSAGKFGVGVVENTLFRLSSIGVPLMFMVNGDLLFSRGFDLDKHAKKTARLVLIILVWRLLSLPLMCEIVQISWRDLGLTEIVSYMFGKEIENVPLGHFWFIYVLVSLYLMFPVLRVAYDSAEGKRSLVFFAVTCLVISFGIKFLADLWGVIGTAQGHGEISFGSLYSKWIFSRYGYAFVYFIIGAFATQWISWLHEKLGTRYRFVLLAVGILSLAVLVTFMSYIEKANDDFLVLALCLSLYALLRDAGTPPAPLASAVKVVGTNTLGIYLLHMFPLMYLRMNPQAFLPETYDAVCIVGIVFTILMGCTVVSAVCRHVPVLGNLFKL